MQCIQVSEDVWTGGQPRIEDLTSLLDKGVQAIVNLREPSEDCNLTSSRDEAIKALELGMEYLNVPLPKQDVSTTRIDDLRTKLKMLPRPVFIHYASGTRSGAVAMIDKAIRNGWTGQETLEQAESVGFVSDNAELREIVREYVDEHRRTEAGD